VAVRSYANKIYELRQIRKEATVVEPLLCRRSPDLLSPTVINAVIRRWPLSALLAACKIARLSRPRSVALS